MVKSDQHLGVANPSAQRVGLENSKRRTMMIICPAHASRFSMSMIE